MSNIGGIYMYAHGLRGVGHEDFPPSTVSLPFRAFNVQQKADALLGYAAVRNVEYVPKANPTRMVSVLHGCRQKHFNA